MEKKSELMVRYQSFSQLSGTLMKTSQQMDPELVFFSCSGVILLIDTITTTSVIRCSSGAHHVGYRITCEIAQFF